MEVRMKNVVILTFMLMSGVLLSCGSDSSEPSLFKVTVYKHASAEGKKNAATGDFYKPSLSYEGITVDPKYTRAITFAMTPFMPPFLKAIPGNGPLILYSDAMDVIVFSPMDNFYISLISFENGVIQYGVEGEISEIPAGFNHRFIMVEGKGMNATIGKWGEELRKDRSIAPKNRYGDKGLSHLGYWTDNGAYYYYMLEPGMTWEQTLLGVKADADAKKIPLGYMQLDSWWYFKDKKAFIGLGSFGGVTEWKPTPETFPEGIAAFGAKLGLPFIAHNRWFAVENSYKSKYEFVDDEKMSLPVTNDVYREFMNDAVSWGIFTYEQDWLINQFWGVKYLREAVGRADAWIKGINDAAAERGLTVQLCMGSAANLMHVVDLPAVTTFRTSLDYQPNIAKEGWWPQFHTVNMLAGALGVLPFKDNFQSAEKYGEAEALISALSSGMVGMSDGIGKAKAELVMATCRSDGLLLKPDRAVTPIDAMFLPHQRPFIAYTESKRKQGTWKYVAAYHLASKHEQRIEADTVIARFMYDARPFEEMFIFPEKVTDWHVDPVSDLGISVPVVAYNWRTKTASVVSGTFDVPEIKDLYDHAYFVLAPIFNNGMALIGEADKYVTMADKRFTDIVVENDSLTVTLAGAASEEVTLFAYDADAGVLLPPVKAVIQQDGTASVSIIKSK
jgi:hypothetical protein